MLKILGEVHAEEYIYILSISRGSFTGVLLKCREKNQMIRARFCSHYSPFLGYMSESIHGVFLPKSCRRVHHCVVLLKVPDRI